MKLYEGKVVSEDIKIGIVAARFNEFIVSKLVSGAQDALVRHGVADEDIALAWVPGAFEIPLAAKRMAESGKYDAVITLGAVIRGATSHYDFVCSEVSKGVANVALGADIPVMFGVLTTDTIEQAIERAGTKAGNKGAECAQGAIEMVNLLREMAVKRPARASSSEGMRLGTLGYRSATARLPLAMRLAGAFHFKIRTSVNADALAHALGAGRSSKTYSPSTIPENRKRVFRRSPRPP